MWMLILRRVWGWLRELAWISNLAQDAWIAKLSAKLVVVGSTVMSFLLTPASELSTWGIALVIGLGSVLGFAIIWFAEKAFRRGRIFIFWGDGKDYWWMTRDLRGCCQEIVAWFERELEFHTTLDAYRTDWILSDPDSEMDLPKRIALSRGINKKGAIPKKLEIRLLPKQAHPQPKTVKREHTQHGDIGWEKGGST